MIRPLLFRAAAVCGLAAALVAGPVAAQEQTPTTKLLPPNVYAYVAVPNVTVLKDRVADSALGAILKDPKLQPTIDQIKAKIGEQSGKVEKELGVSLDDLLKIPSGELAFAVVDIPGESVGLVLILDYGDSGATIDKLIAKAETGLQEKDGATRRVEQFEGTEITVYEKAAGDTPANDDLDLDGDAPAAGGNFSGTTAWFRKDNRLVLGNGLPVLEAILARWDGSHSETFAGNETFTTIAGKLRTDDRDPAIIYYADPLGGLQTALTRAQNLPPQVQLVAGLLPMLGLTSLKGVGGSLDFATKDYDTINKFFLYVEPPPTGDLGLLGVFKFKSGELAPPDWVTDSATGYFGANWDVTTAVGSVRKLVDTFQGPGAFDQLMQKAAQAPEGPKLHPQKDLLDQLTGLIHIAYYPLVAPRAGAETVEGQARKPQPFLIAFNVKDDEAMGNVLAKLAATPAFPGETREYQGTTVYELPMKGAPGAEQGKMAVAVAKGHLFLATEVPRLEDVLRGNGGTPLAQTEGFKTISGHIPDSVTMLGYQTKSAQAETVYEMLRSGKADGQLEGFDFSTLPPFEDISKYLLSTGSYGVPDEKGALLVSFSLKLAE